MQSQSTEEWRPVVGYEGWYSVSSHGRVRRDRTGRRTHSGLILKQVVRSSDGYLAVGLSKDSKSRLINVHILVCEAWHGVRPDGKTVNHIDGIKTNNAPPNLEWVTPKENSEHAVKFGLMPNGDRSSRRLHPEAYPFGERHPQARLNEEIVREILTSPLTQDALAIKFGVTQRTISVIRQRIGWKHVTI